MKTILKRKFTTKAYSNIYKSYRIKNALSMKILLAIVFFLFMFAGIGNATQWTLVWSDEFNYKGKPDSSKWLHEVGIVRNGEAAYFTTRLENVRVEGGVLIIEARKENYLDAAYTSGSIATDNRKEFRYGRMEVRAKMPDGKGSHVGIWFHGSNIGQVDWPECGELDLLEYVGRIPDIMHIYTHYTNPFEPTKHSIETVSKFLLREPYKNFHTYAMEWDEREINYFMDNRHVGTFALDIAGTGSSNPFRKNQVFNLTYSLGGWGWEIDDGKLPGKFEVDYVRFYKPIEVPANSATLTPINSLLLSN